MSEGPEFVTKFEWRGADIKVKPGQWRTRNHRSVTVLAKIDVSVDHRGSLGWTWSANLCWLGICFGEFGSLPTLLSWDQNGIYGGDSAWDLKEAL